MCTGCKKTLYPRIDPVVIMLVVGQDNRILLGRKNSHPKGMWTCLAGFIEPGESIEEAVRREVMEEVGITVNVQDVHYVSSQPWPFLGGQLMIGCYAKATTEKIVVDLTELDDARWFTLGQVKEALANSDNFASDFRMPPRLAIAHMLAVSFLEKEECNGAHKSAL